jgi:hypothetical protein
MCPRFVLCSAHDQRQEERLAERDGAGDAGQTRRVGDGEALAAR